VANKMHTAQDISSSNRLATVTKPHINSLRTKVTENSSNTVSSKATENNSSMDSKIQATASKAAMTVSSSKVPILALEALDQTVRKMAREACLALWEEEPQEASPDIKRAMDSLVP